jgi:hypothetical protein
LKKAKEQGEERTVRKERVLERNTVHLSCWCHTTPRSSRSDPLLTPLVSLSSQSPFHPNLCTHVSLSFIVPIIWSLGISLPNGPLGWVPKSTHSHLHFVVFTGVTHTSIPTAYMMRKLAFWCIVLAFCSPKVCSKPTHHRHTSHRFSLTTSAPPAICCTVRTKDMLVSVLSEYRAAIRAF